MGLLAGYRRMWAVAATAALALPALIQLAVPSQTVSQHEARRLAPAPAMPETLSEWLSLPRALDKFLGDHFGGRDNMVRANGLVRYAMGSPSSPYVVLGRDGQMFVNGDGMIEQTLGLLNRDTEMEQFADFAATLANDYAARGIAFVVAIPPNASTIARAAAPRWFSYPDRTEYDDMMRALAARHVQHVDLRASLMAARERVYRRTDTHWNDRGALIAYNDVVKALGRNDWAVAPDAAFNGARRAPGGDLARMLGISADISETVPALDLRRAGAPPLQVSAIDTRQAETSGNLTLTGRDGPSVVILGDSFTETSWRPYLALHAGRIAWIHHEMCGFHPDVVEAQKPDIVILAPTERFMFCWNSKRPPAR